MTSFCFILQTKKARSALGLALGPGPGGGGPGLAQGTGDDFEELTVVAERPFVVWEWSDSSFHIALQALQEPVEETVGLEKQEAFQKPSAKTHPLSWPRQTISKQVQVCCCCCCYCCLPPDSYEAASAHIPMYNVSTETGRKMSQAGGDPKRLQRATAQPDGHAVVVGEPFFYSILFFVLWRSCVKTHAHLKNIHCLTSLGQAAWSSQPFLFSYFKQETKEKSDCQQIP